MSDQIKGLQRSGCQADKMNQTYDRKNDTQLLLKLIH